MIDNRVPQLIIMISGAVALITGIVMLSIQFLHDLNVSAATPAGHFGFTILAIGAILEAIGYLATLPWRPRPT